MGKYIVIGSLLTVLLAALYVSQNLFTWLNRSPGRQAIDQTRQTPTPTITGLPITKSGNIEAVVGPQGSRRLLSVSGQLVKVRLEGGNDQGTAGTIIIDAVYNNEPLVFQAVLPEAILIDDRDGLYRTIDLRGFVQTSPTRPVFVQCNVAFQTETGNTRRCLSLVLKERIL